MGRYTMGATVRDVIILLHYVPIPSSQKQYKQDVRRCLVVRAFLLRRRREFAMPYVSRDGQLVFVPADASSISGRDDVARVSAGWEQEINCYAQGAWQGALLA